MDWLDKISEFWPHLAAGFSLLAALLAPAHAQPLKLKPANSASDSDDPRPRPKTWGQEDENDWSLIFLTPYF